MRAIGREKKLINKRANAHEAVRGSSRDNVNTPSSSRSTNTKQLAVAKHHVKDTRNNPLLENTRKRFRFTSDIDLIQVQVELLRHVSEDEQLYRNKQFEVLTHVLNTRLHCTACDVHIGYHHGQNLRELSHPFLKALCCPQCVSNIRKANLPFSISKREKYCWWCAEPESEFLLIRNCCSCPFTFCHKCLLRNLGFKNLSRSNDWLCPVCDITQLWRLRGVYCALLRYSRLKRSQNPNGKGDVSQCCVKNSTQTEVYSGQSSSNDQIAAAPGSFTPQTIFLKDSKDMTQGSERFNEHGEQAVKMVVQNLPHTALLNRKINAAKLKVKLNQICAYTAMLNANIHKLFESLSDDEDEEKVDSCVGILKSLLTMGSNQLPTFIKEVQSFYKK